MSEQLILAGNKNFSSIKKEIINPYTNLPIKTVNFATKDQLKEAVEKAVKSFDETRKLPSNMRAKICFDIAKKINERESEFIDTIIKESGKPYVYAKGEFKRCIDTFTIAGEEAKRMDGHFFSLDAVTSGENRQALTKRFPEGIVLGITPFNFPLNLVAHKIAPAIAVGNPIIIKPASKTPLTALLLGSIIMETDWPRDAISVLPCDSRIASLLVEDPYIKILSFTGSPDVGWALKKQCGKKKIILELGGNAGVIVHKDMNEKMAYIIDRCVVGSFAFSGQVCISVQRIFVHNLLFGEFIEAFKQKTSNLVTGDPLDEKTNFAVMIDEENAIRIEEWVTEAVKNGAKIIIGGKREGSFYQPTILTNVKTTDKVCSSEAFGPIVIVEKYNDFENALQMINDSEYGLQAGIFTNDINLILKAYDVLDVGGVIINDVPIFRVDQMPYGGNKNSGFGREGIKYTMEEYSNIKLMVINQNI